MDFFTLIIVLAVIVLLPVFAFFGLVGLALLIWSWGRIGRYFINFGRWLADWRNFVPLSVLGLISVILALIILPLVGVPSIITIILMVVLVAVTVVIFFFASIAWAGALSGWFWPRWRKLIWNGFASLWGSVPSGSRKGPRGRPKPTAEAPTQKRPPQKRSGLAGLWALMLGKPLQPAKSAASAQPGAANVQPPSEGAPAKRSWFGTFWALMLGKPQPKRQRARPTRVQTTEQTLGPSGGPAAIAGSESGASDRASSAVPRARGAKPAKRSWFGSFWALMLGKPSKSGQRKAQPERARTVDRGDRPAQTTAAVDAKTGATARATAATSAEKPKKRGFFGGMAQKVGEGIEWIRVRLNLD